MDIFSPEKSQCDFEEKETVNDIGELNFWLNEKESCRLHDGNKVFKTLFLFLRPPRNI